MRLLLIGPPGSGKGTQAKMLAEREHVVHFGMGDILREAVHLGTPAGLLAGPFVAQGHLVPDVVVNEMVREVFSRPDRPDRFLMDGYPRTCMQAGAFDQLIQEQRLPLDAAVLLDVDDDEIVRRLSGRWICPECHTPYNLSHRPPRFRGVCDACGTLLLQRPDDRQDIVRERLILYHRTTVELTAYYRERGLLRPVSGSGTIEEIYQRILQAIRAA